ncbi:hypothetical protein BH160DRAFT_6328 [Burkholderia sp. H160]|nr:hypothetical protein BH160DRAFT_6328 [Burkholderia sp. H160]
MLVYLFQQFQQRLLRPGYTSALRALCAGWFAHLHVSVLAACVSLLVHTPLASNASGARVAQSRGTDRKSLRLLGRATRMAARAALRAAHAGRPLTPTGYAILATTVTIGTVLATLTGLACDDPESALRSRRWLARACMPAMN